MYVSEDVQLKVYMFKVAISVQSNLNTACEVFSFCLNNVYGTPTQRMPYSVDGAIILSVTLVCHKCWYIYEGKPLTCQCWYECELFVLFRRIVASGDKDNEKGLQGLILSLKSTEGRLLSRNCDERNYGQAASFLKKRENGLLQKHFHFLNVLYMRKNIS